MTAAGILPAAQPVPGEVPFGGVEDERQFCDRMLAEMEADRQTMIPWWRSLSQFFSPRSPRIDRDQTARGHHLNRHLLDETPLFARRTLAAGLHWGITNPSREWKQLALPDVELGEHPAISDWLHVTNERMSAILARGNFYQAMERVYDEVTVYATASFLVEEDERDVIRCVPWGIGSYGLADNASDEVESASRVFKMSVRQILDRFGERDAAGQWKVDRFSARLAGFVKQRKYAQMIDVAQLITPNADYDGERRTPEYKRYASFYWEYGVKPLTTKQRYLAKEGYDEWPLIVFRWRRAVEEVWGVDAPAMMVLGSAKSLQTVERTALKLIEKGADPPIQGPSSFLYKRVGLLPAEFTANEDGAANPIKAIHEVNLAALDRVTAKQVEMRERVFDAFFTRLMLFLSSVQQAGDRTAREVEEISQEKYLVFGSVLENFNGSLTRFIDRLFGVMLRRGMIPEAPEMLQGLSLRVEYTSIMAQAQKAAGMDSLVSFALRIAEIAKATGDPGINIKVDWPQWVDEFGKRSSVPPRVIRSDEDVEAIQAAQAEQMAEERRVALAEQESKVAANLGQTPMESGGTALDALMRAGQQGGLPA